MEQGNGSDPEIPSKEIQDVEDMLQIPEAEELSNHNENAIINNGLSESSVHSQNDNAVENNSSPDLISADSQNFHQPLQDENIIQPVEEPPVEQSPVEQPAAFDSMSKVPVDEPIASNSVLQFPVELPADISADLEAAAIPTEAEAVGNSAIPVDQQVAPLQSESAPESQAEESTGVHDDIENDDNNAIESTPEQEDEMDGVQTISNDLESIASFFGVSTEVLESMDQQTIWKLSFKMDEFHKVEATNSVMEVSFEHYKHSSAKKIESLAKELTQVKAKCDTLDERDESLKSELKENKEVIAKLEKELASEKKLAEDNYQQAQRINQEKSNIYEMFTKKHEEIADLNKEISRLTSLSKDTISRMRDIESTEQKTSVENNKLTFEVARLNQEISLVKQSSEWYEEELKRKVEELKEFRDSKRKQISELESSLDKCQQDLAIYTSRSENQAKSLGDLNLKYDKSLMEVKKLNDKIALQKENFAKEMSTKNKLLEILTRSSKESTDRVDELENVLQTTKEEVAKEAADIKLLLEETNEKLAASEANAKRLEDTISNLTQNGNVTSAFYGSDNNNILGDLDASNMADSTIMFSPIAQRIVKNMGDGASVTQFYADFQNLKKKYLFEKHQKETIQRELNEFIDEFERKAPILEAEKQRSKMLESQISEISSVLESSAKQKESMLNENRILQKRAKEYEMAIKSLEKKNTDSRRQVATLLTEITLREKNDAPLTDAERKKLHHLLESSSYKEPNETDTDELISNRLVIFKNVADLVQQNEELLSATRALGAKLEEEESLRDQKVSELEAEVLEETKKAIIELKTQLDHTEEQLKTVTAHRDMLQNRLSTAEVNSTEESNSKALVPSDYVSSDVYQNLKSDFEHRKSEDRDTIRKLEQDISDLQKERYTLSIELSRARSTAQLNEDRYNSSQDLLKYAKAENNDLRESIARAQQNLSKLEQDSKRYADEFFDAKTAKNTLEIELKGLLSEKTMLKSIEERLRSENNDLVEAKSRLNSMVSILKSNEQEQQHKYNNSVEQMNKTIEELKSSLSTTMSKLEASNDEVKRVLTSKNIDSRIYQQRIDSLNAEVKLLTESLGTKSLKVEQLTTQVTSLTVTLEEIRSKKSSSSVVSSIVSSTADIATLKEELNNAYQELEIANNSAQTFENISKSTERELSSFRDSYEEFRKSSEESIASAQSEIESLQKSLEEVNSELSNTKQELDELKAIHSQKLTEDASEIQSLRSQVEIAEYSKSDLESRIQLIKEELSQKSQILSQTTTEYQTKLDELKTLSDANGGLNIENEALREKIQELEQSLSEAKSALIIAEENFNSQNISVETELKSKQDKIEELDSQNRTLINQLESSSSRFESLEGDQGLKDMVAYMKRTNDSLEEQLRLARSEENRLRQSLTINEDELVEIKAELVKAQEKIAGAGKVSDVQAEIQDKLHELELFRENNKDLRSQNQELTNKFDKLSTEYNALKEDSLPMRQKIEELTADVDIKQKELDLNKEQVEYWKKRADEILSNINNSQADNQVTLLQQIESLKASEAASIEKVAELEGKLSKIRVEAQTKLDKSKANLIRLNQEKTDLMAQIASLKDNSGDSASSANATSGDQEKLTQELEKVSAELTESKKAIEKMRFEYTVNSNKFNAEISSLKATIKKLNEDASTVSDSASADQNKIIEQLKEALEKEKKVRVDPESLEEIKQFKAKIEEECHKNLEDHKNRLRAPSSAKINSVIEQRWAARSAELEKQYEAKLKELETNGAKTVDKEAITKEVRAELQQEFKDQMEKEKQSLKVEMTNNFKKEFEIKENFLKRKIASLEGKLSAAKPDTTQTSAPAIVTSTPTAASKPSIFGFGGTPTASNAGLPSRPTTATDSVPAKRPSEETTSNEEKKFKSDN